MYVPGGEVPVPPSPVPEISTSGVRPETAEVTMPEAISPRAAMPQRSLPDDTPAFPGATNAEVLIEETNTTEHPQADEIRKQVEYYFSDENLPTDEHLLKKCSGRDNVPVLIKSIHGFPKMRKYKPFRAVVNALKSSVFLDVVDNKYVKRKVALVGPTILDPKDGDDYDEEDEKNEEIERRRTQIANEVDRAARAVALSKPKTPKPTGFEEYFADAPVTPAEAAEEQEVYEQRTALESRVEIAIYRYRSKRKFDEQQQTIFDRFMAYGGIVTGPCQYTGSQKDDLFINRSKGDKALLLCTYHAGFDKTEDQWVVDFEGVAKGFFSSHFFFLMDRPTIKDVERGTNVVRNFYKYLLHHNALPECTADIKKAIAVADLAEKEVPVIMAARDRLPGRFNLACSILFGGRAPVGLMDSDEDKDFVQPSWYVTTSTTMTRKDARDVFIQGFCKGQPGGDRLMTRMTSWDRAEWAKSYKKLSQRAIGLEVTAIDYGTIGHGLGKLTCKPWVVPGFAEHDTAAGAALAKKKWAKLSEAEKQKHRAEGTKFWLEKVPPNPNRQYKFKMENDVLRVCLIGMKIQAVVCKVALLGIDCKDSEVHVEYMDLVKGVWSSFYTFLPNELVMETKKKEVIFYKSQVEIDEMNALGRKAKKEARKAERKANGEDDSDSDATVT